MGTLRWYKRDPRAALIGMQSMTLEQIGAYNLILDLLYIHDGAIVDHPRQMCRWLGVSTARWQQLRTALIARNKIYVLGGNLRNERVDRELADAQRMAAKRQAAANARWHGNGTRDYHGTKNH